MPFRNLYYLPAFCRGTHHTKSKKERSRIRTMNHKKIPKRSYCFGKSGKVSALTLANGSITVEAAMAVPIFFFAAVSLLYLVEMMCIQTAVRSGLQYAGKIAAQEASIVTAVVPSKVESDIVNAVGAGRLNRSIIEGGSTGLDCTSSRISPKTGIGELTAEYQVRIPIPIFHIPPITHREGIRIKAWTGYEKEAFGAKDSETVYVTETGLVYHRDYHCTYLELSIRAVPEKEVSSLRSEDGEKYYPCEHCGKQTGGSVYITNYGNRYHNSLSCNGVKRTVYAVPLSEVVGKGECSRCGH